MILYRWFYDTFKHRTTSTNTLSGKKHCTTVPSHNYSIQCSTFVKCQLHYKTINSFYRIVTNWQRFLLKFLPIFKSISCFFSNIFSQSYRIPCFSGISIGIEFYWQSMEGQQLDPRYWLSFLHPELLPYIQEGPCIVYISSLLSWIVATNRPIVLFLPLPESAPHWQPTYQPSTDLGNSIKLSTRPVLLHMC